MSGDTRDIATQFHTTVCGAVFRIPLLDFVRCALSYNSQAISIESLLYTVYELRNDLRLVFRNRPEIKELYIKVQKVSKYYSVETILTIIDIIITISPTSLLDRC
jgi:hypothetical protein